jgi:putative transposase
VWCDAEQLGKAGQDHAGEQRYRCVACDRRQTGRSASPFRGYRFPVDSIALAVRWYVCSRLSSADVAERLVECGVHVDPSTVFDWVQRVTPLYRELARPRRHLAGGTWSIDET